ncbi:unnamed protein product [Cochlearia groenlandica]
MNRYRSGLQKGCEEIAEKEETTQRKKKGIRFCVWRRQGGEFSKCKRLHQVTETEQEARESLVFSPEKKKILIGGIAEVFFF